jgi:hypothetical protein
MQQTARPPLWPTILLIALTVAVLGLLLLGLLIWNMPAYSSGPILQPTPLP